MISNFGDWTVEYLFEKIGAFSCSRDRFSRVIEAALHPLGRRGPAQATLAEHLNAVFRRDGYRTINGSSSRSMAHIISVVTGSPRWPSTLTWFPLTGIYA